MLVIAGNFNCPLQFERIHIGNHDPRFAAALQIDKQTFQQLVVDLDQIAVHYRNKYTPIFLHDTHRSRIDFIFLRAFQLQWRHLQPIVIVILNALAFIKAPSIDPCC